MIFITRLIRGNIKKKREKKAVATRCAISLRILRTRKIVWRTESEWYASRAFMTRSLFLSRCSVFVRPTGRLGHREGESRHRIRDKSGWPTDLCLSCRIIARGSRETAPADRLRQETDFCGRTCRLSNVVDVNVIKSSFVIKVHAEKHPSFNSFTLLNCLCVETC